ncbi:hypothetical protein FZC66_06770 [Priestia megaterium]|nr:hypothetical protein FZC66_06770 [Priestia megaterium]
MIDRINGYLLAMEHLNHFTNHGYTFVFEEIPQTETIEKSLRAYFGDEYGNHVLCLDYQKRLTEVLQQWFFEREAEYKRKDHTAFTEQDGRVHGFLELLFTFVNEANLNVYEVESNCIWHCYTQYFIFESQSKLFVLELGVDD